MSSHPRNSRHSGRMGISAAATIPGFIKETSDAIATNTGDKGNILIVIQLAGGNDGLNTIIPFGDDQYYRSRPTLAVEPRRVLKIDDYFGFHPKLYGLRSLYDSGDLGILHGVGYPNPNRSHFRSMEIWETASDAHEKQNTGWLGRYFDHCCVGSDPTIGISIGEMLPQAFRANKPTGVSFERPADYRWTPVDSASADGLAETVFAATNNLLPDSGESDVSTARLFLHRVALNARISSHQILALDSQDPANPGYPDTPFGNALRMIARMIRGGFKTRVYYATQSGYDTHNTQAPTHDRLIEEFSNGITALCQNLKDSGDFDRVTILSFSEFGRRVAENGSSGTDHGKAAPVFLFGGHVRPGMHGTFPSLSDLDDGDQRHNTDFRSVYSGLLKDWLGVSPELVLGKPFPGLSIFK